MGDLRKIFSIGAKLFVRCPWFTQTHDMDQLVITHLQVVNTSGFSLQTMLCVAPRLLIVSHLTRQDNAVQLHCCRQTNSSEGTCWFSDLH